MADVTEENGLMVNNMEKDHTKLVLVKKNMVSGKRANVSDGSAEENLIEKYHLRQ